MKKDVARPFANHFMGMAVLQKGNSFLEVAHIQFTYGEQFVYMTP